MDHVLHLSIPVRDLDEAVDFYVRVLDCPSGRRRDGWADVWLFGLQVTLQDRPTEVLPPEQVGVRHFGVALDAEGMEAPRRTVTPPLILGHMGSGLGELAAVVDRLDPEVLADGESVVELQRLCQQLDAVRAEAVARFDASREWAADGAKTAAAWLAWRCRIPQQHARRMVRLGRACRDELSVTADAWRDGRIDAAHVSLLAAARTERTAQVLARDEELLVEQAATLRFSHFQRVVAYWRQRADPDGADADAGRLRDDRRFDISPTFQGAVVGDFVLDPIGGAIVTGELQRIDGELFKADWNEARERLGRDPLVSELRRSAKQRRADALVEMATRSATPDKQGRRPAPLFTVFVGYETFAGRICQLADGTVVAPGALVPHLRDADIERVVFDSPSRVIDIGETRRFYTGAARRAVQVRDRECFHHTCDEPAEHAQVDHVIPWAAGGPTTQTNGRVACGFHNRQRHTRRSTTDDDPP